jgi:hypothetical protein
MTNEIRLEAKRADLFEPRTRAALASALPTHEGFIASLVNPWTVEEDLIIPLAEYRYCFGSIHEAPLQQWPRALSPKLLAQLSPTVFLLSDDQHYEDACRDCLSRMRPYGGQSGEAEIFIFPDGIIALQENHFDIIDEAMLSTKASVIGPEHVRNAISVVLDGSISNHALVHSVARMNSFLGAMRHKWERGALYSPPRNQEIASLELVITT